VTNFTKHGQNVNVDIFDNWLYLH